MSTAEQYWFNTETRQVEKGPQSHYSNRMGPYPTREAASRAMDTAAARTEAWDDEDDTWDNGPPKD